MVSSSFNVLSLCSGYGGLDLAVGRAIPTSRTVCYIEREAYSAAILASRMEDGSMDAAPVWSDLSSFDSRRWSGAVDLVAAGFPCQDISVAGKGAGIEGERSGLWKQVLRVIDECGANYAFLENVSALVRRGLDVVLDDLAALGFDAEWGCYTAREVGAPHKRERIFILAHRSSARLEGCGEGLPRYGSDRVADAQGERGGEGRPEWSAEGRALPDGVGALEGLADAVHLAGHDAAWGQHDRAEARSVSWRDGAPVGEEALPDAQRIQVRLEPERDQWEGRGVRETVGGDVESGLARGSWASPFPPGPDDLDGWRQLLIERPDVEPAIRRDAHGLAGRVDRLRALGNGVVPQQAELAFRELWERVHAD